MWLKAFIKQDSDQDNDQVDDQVDDQVKKGAIDQLTEEQKKVLKYCLNEKANREIQQKALRLKPHRDNFQRYIEPLLEQELLMRTIPNKPTSKTKNT